MMPPGSLPPADLPFRWGDQVRRLGRLVRKELFEILRDRRTIITLVLMPLLLYPLLSLAFQQFLLAHAAADQGVEYRIGTPTEGEGKLIGNFLDWLGQAAKAEFSPSGSRPGKEPVLKLFFPRRKEDEKDPKYLERIVRNKEVELGVRVCNLAQAQAAAKRHTVALNLELIYREDSELGREALAWMKSRCALANTLVLKTQPGPPGVRQRDLAIAREAEAKPPNFLAVLVPLILILMTITGAVYPAIDLTAGERERGTLEILVAAPVPRLGLLFAKYVTVLAVAMLTALANVVMMTLTLLVTGLGPALFGDTGITPGVVLEVFGLMLLFAAFFSGVLLAVASFSRSFKEAQAYLIPLMLVSLTPGMLAVKADLHLTVPLAVTPLINIVLLARDLFQEQAEPFVAVVVVLSTLLYALAALALAARIFGAEGVLYSEQSGWSDLFRRPAQPQRAATVSGALFCLALLFTSFFLVNGLIGQWRSGDPGLRVGVLGVADLALFAGFPLAAVYLGRVRLASGFQLHPGSWLGYPGAILLGLSLWPFVLEIQLVLKSLGLTTLGSEHEKRFAELLASWRGISPVLIVFVYALVTPICEELFFRGYLFSALRAYTGAKTAIFGSALLFGLFHVVFAFDRLVPSTLLGIVLGWVCWRTGSVFPGMIMHACHNGFLVLVSYYEKEITGQGWFNPNQSHLPWTWLVGAGVTAGLGGLLIGLAGRRPRPEEEPMDNAAEATP
jgi:ABC-2 type transport system permease protein/sodium transport system permease protein